MLRLCETTTNLFRIPSRCSVRLPYEWLMVSSSLPLSIHWNLDRKRDPRWCQTLGVGQVLSKHTVSLEKGALVHQYREKSASVRDCGYLSTPLVSSRLFLMLLPWARHELNLQSQCMKFIHYHYLDTLPIALY